MDDRFTVVWILQRPGDILPHYTDITIHHGPINKGTVTSALLKEVNKGNALTHIEVGDLYILSWNRLE